MQSRLTHFCWSFFCAHVTTSWLQAKREERFKARCKNAL